MALTKIDDRGLKTPIDLLDDEKIRFGTGNDLSIYHSGGNNYIDGNSTAEDPIFIRANVGADHSSNIHLQAKSGEDSLVCMDDESVALYYDGVQKLSTKSWGVEWSGDLENNSDSSRIKMGADDDLQIYHDGPNNNSYITNGNNAGTFLVKSDFFQIDENQTGDHQLRCRNGFVELYYDGVKKLYTDNAGVVVQ